MQIYKDQIPDSSKIENKKFILICEDDPEFLNLLKISLPLLLREISDECDIILLSTVELVRELSENTALVPLVIALFTDLDIPPYANGGDLVVQLLSGIPVDHRYSISAETSATIQGISPENNLGKNNKKIVEKIRQVMAQD